MLVSAREFAATDFDFTRLGFIFGVLLYFMLLCFLRLVLGHCYLSALELFDLIFSLSLPLCLSLSLSLPLCLSLSLSLSLCLSLTLSLCLFVSVSLSLSHLLPVPLFLCLSFIFS